jgi:hypothetical protein
VVTVWLVLALSVVPSDLVIVDVIVPGDTTLEKFNSSLYKP